MERKAEIRVAVDTALKLRQKVTAREVVQNLVQAARGIGAERGNGFADRFSRCGSKEVGLCRLPQILCVGQKQGNPFGVVGKAAVKAPELFGQPVVAAVTEQMIHHVRKAVSRKARKRVVWVLGMILGIAVVEGGHGIFHDRERHFVQFRFVREAEGGGESELREACADFLAEKRVDGGDMRAAEREHLPREVGILGICRERVSECFCNSAFQFCRRRAGEGDDQKSGKLCGVLGVGQHPDDALGQDACLSRPCCRRDDQQSSPQSHGIFLRCRPCSCHLFSFPGVDLGTLSQALLRGLLEEEVTLRYWRLLCNRHP